MALPYQAWWIAERHLTGEQRNATWCSLFTAQLWSRPWAPEDSKPHTWTSPTCSSDPGPFLVLHPWQSDFFFSLLCEAQVMWAVCLSVHVWLSQVGLMEQVNGRGKYVHVYWWGGTGLLTLGTEVGGEASVQSEDLWSVLCPSSCWACLRLPSSCRAWLLPLSTPDILHIKSAIPLLQLSLIHLCNLLQISFPSAFTLIS